MKLLEHFKELTIHPKNAEELKGLILQLAIQGKLTRKWREQNPNVEPASVLLEKIQEEKSRLVKEKKIKKEKALPKISESEISFELPKSWNWCRLNSLGLIGSSSRVHKKDWQTSGVPFYRAREIVKLSKHGFVDNDLFITEELFQNHKKNGIVPDEDDIMLTGVGTIGIPYVVKKADIFYFKDASVLIFKNLFNLFPDYLDLFFSTPYWKREIHRESMGTTVHTLTISRAKLVPTIFPPVAEQKAIVVIVNQLFAEVEALEAQTKARVQLKENFVTSALHRLTTGETDKEWRFLQDHFKTFFTEKTAIQKLRESILQLAVQGKLTSSWRASNPELVSGSNSAQELLERIKAVKAQLVKEKKIKKEKPLPPISKDEIPYDLPEGWVWCRLGEIITFLNGYAFKSSTYVQSSKYQVIRLGNVKNDNFLIDTKKAFVPEKIGSETLDYALYKDDILTTLTGTKDKRDYCFTCLVKSKDLEESVLLLNQRVGCIRAIDKSSSELMNKFLKSKAILNQLFEQETGTANQGNIGSTAFKNLVYPFPPKEEQNEIVEKVNTLMELCHLLEQEIENSETQIEKLMQSCLREVFEGDKEIEEDLKMAAEPGAKYKFS